MTQKLIYVPGYQGGEYVDFMIVGEAPGAKEEELGRPFSGISGQFLLRSLFNMNVHIDNLYLTNVVKVRPEGNRAPTKVEVKSWIPLLQAEVFEMIEANPGLKIIALGNTAIDALDTFCKEDYFGIPHPSWALRFGKQKIFLEALKSCVKNPDKRL